MALTPKKVYGALKTFIINYVAAVALNGVPVNYPKVVSGRWQVFDPVANAYIDTGIYARGSRIRINSVTENWEISEDDGATWTDTGASARGLTGAQGSPGQKGDTGDTGATGSDGLSAFEVWKAQGNTGTEAVFLASLRGDNGVDGFSPTITVKTNTATQYILTITTKTGTFDTPNLMGQGNGTGTGTLDSIDIVAGELLFEVDVTDPANPRIGSTQKLKDAAAKAETALQAAAVDGTTIEGDGTTANPLKLADALAAKINGLNVKNAQYDSSLNNLTITFADGSTEVISLVPVSVFKDIYYDSATSELVFVLPDDSEVRVPITVPVYTGGTTDTVEVTVTNNVISAEVIDGSIGKAKLDSNLADEIDGNLAAVATDGDTVEGDGTSANPVKVKDGVFVQQVAGKGLSANDFTNELASKLNGVNVKNVVYNSATNSITITFADDTTETVNLVPVEVFANIYYDDQTNELVFVLLDNSEVRVPIELPEGKSAYEVAVANGFVGDEAAWLASLVGATGAAGATGAEGQSAFDAWIAAGNSGTVTDFLESLVGATGATGATGTTGAAGNDGASVSVQSGLFYDDAIPPADLTNLTQLPAFDSTSVGQAFTVKTPDDVLDLYFHGANGANWTIVPNWGGIPGPKGEPGTPGTNGINGVNGREVEFQTTATYIQWRRTGDTVWTNLVALSALQGPKGDKGIDGNNGQDGESILLQMNGNILQYRYPSTSWINLFDFTDIINGKAPANAALNAETGAGTDVTTNAVASNTVANILQTIWGKIRNIANVLSGKQPNITATGSTNLLTAPTSAGGQPGTKAINTLLAAPAAQTANTQLLVAPATQGGTPTLKAIATLAASDQAFIRLGDTPTPQQIQDAVNCSYRVIGSDPLSWPASYGTGASFRSYNSGSYTLHLYVGGGNVWYQMTADGGLIQKSAWAKLANAMYEHNVSMQFTTSGGVTNGIITFKLINNSSTPLNGYSAVATALQNAGFTSSLNLIAINGANNYNAAAYTLHSMYLVNATTITGYFVRSSDGAVGTQTWNLTTQFSNFQDKVVTIG